MKLPENSLFAILLRARWWVSFGVGAVAFFLLRLLVPAPYAAFAAAPFLAIGFYVLYRELRRPSGRRIAATLAKAREMAAEEFAQALQAAFRREGYAVKPADGAADLELTFQGRTTLVAFRRWKATRTGVEPLRELQEAKAEGSRMYVAAGEITDTARKYAADNKIRLVEQEELARLLAR
jgi:restriction system protein